MIYIYTYIDPKYDVMIYYFGTDLIKIIIRLKYIISIE